MRSVKRPDLDDVHAQFEAWRASGVGGRRALPERLLRAAVDLLDRYGSSTICRRLRLNGTRFKRARAAFGVAKARATGAQRTFVELPVPASVGPRNGPWAAVETGSRPAECRVVFEPASGGRLSVEFARLDGASFEALSRLLLSVHAGTTVIGHAAGARRALRQS
jgi:hypothetical protein